MRNYEFMVAFTCEEDQYKTGSEALRNTLTSFGAEIVKEEPYGDRDLCYIIKKQTRGRYVLFNLKVDPSKIIEINRQLKLNTSILTSLFVRVDE